MSDLDRAADGLRAAISNTDPADDSNPTDPPDDSNPTNTDRGAGNPFASIDPPSAPSTPPDGYLPISLAVSRAGVSHRTLVRWAQSGRVTAVLHEGRWFIDPETLPEVGTEPETEPTPAPGTVLVPLTAWERSSSGAFLTNVRRRVSRCCKWR